MIKNTPGQFWQVFAFNDASGLNGNPGNPVEDDQDNITAEIKIDDGAPAATADTNPTQLPGKGGYYQFALAQAETNGVQLWIYPVSSTPGVSVVGVLGYASPYTVVTTIAPYDESRGVLILSQNSDYKIGTAGGPLLIPIGASNVLAGDVVYFGAVFEQLGSTETIYVPGVVVSSGGTLYAQFEIDGETLLAKTPSTLWRWGIEHVNAVGRSSITQNQPLTLLPDRVSA